MRTSTLILLTVGTVLLLSLATGARATDAVLQRYIDLALSQNPRIWAADHRVEAADQRISQAGALPDPLLGISLKEYPLRGAGTDRLRMATKSVSLDQMLPWPGLRGADRRIAGADHEQTAALARNERVMLSLDVKTMYHEWQRVRAELVLVDSSRYLLEEIATQTRSAYAAGVGNLSDLLRAQTELSKLEAMRADLIAMQKKAVADLNVCCQLPLDFMTTPPSPLEFRPQDYNIDSVMARVTADSPELQAADLRETMANLAVKSARLQARPGLSVGVEYMRRDVESPASGGSQWETDNMISLMGGITLPVFRRSKQDRLITQRQREASQAADERSVVFNDLHLAVSKALADLAAQREQIELYRDRILPQASATLDAALAGYAGGKVEFMVLLSSDLNVIDLSREQARRIAAYATAQARIQAAMGEANDED
jgi:outer membrane protein, heavy metal efflux system